MFSNRSPALSGAAYAAIVMALTPGLVSAQTMGGWLPAPAQRQIPAPPAGTIELLAPAPTPAPHMVEPPASPAMPLVSLVPGTANPQLPSLSRATTGQTAMPVVMFRANPPPEPSPVQQEVTVAKPPPEPAYQPVWQPPVQAQISPPYQYVSETSALPQLREPRGPWTRIYQDSRRAVVRDLPEALADSLPWVDRDRKDESLDEVLARVSDELTRARISDPEWANAAERELRALDARLDRMPEPPPETAGSIGHMAEPANRHARPFRPRPVWPGAQATSEPQVRPATLTTFGIEDTGPTAQGVAGSWTPPIDFEPVETAPPPPPRTQQRRGRRQ
jgi:hypothetical protein